MSTVPPPDGMRRPCHARGHEPGKTVSQWGGFIEGVERVNPALFGLGPKTRRIMDPLIRLFTETSLAAVLDSSYDRASLKGRRVGVFAGARAGRYAERIASPGKNSVTGVGQNFIAAFVSHVLDLRGPSLVLDSACSSSLAAVHLACQSLQSGDSELAIAGGVDLLLDEKSYLFLSAAHALSPDGRCRTFDEKANGFVPGEGVGCVLLKPLAQAMADGDHVYAVIDGSAINNDGRTLGITTPGVEGQVDVIERALQKAGAAPSTVSYVEAHGTGTMIGDPIELRALARVFANDPPASLRDRQREDQRRPSALGGGDCQLHQGGAGAASPDACRRPCTAIRSTRGSSSNAHRFSRSWRRGRGRLEAGVRRAGISAFGFGKTNVHVVVSERPGGATPPVDLDAAPPGVAEPDKIYAWRHRGGAGRAGVGAEPQLLALESSHLRITRGGMSEWAPRESAVSSRFGTRILWSTHTGCRTFTSSPASRCWTRSTRRCRRSAWTCPCLALRNILFHEPVVTNAQIDRKLTVTVDVRGSEGRVTVTSLPWKNDRALAADHHHAHDVPAGARASRSLPRRPRFARSRSRLRRSIWTPVTG